MPTTLTAYIFDELSPEARERALRSLPYDDCEDSVSECIDSLKAFSRATGITLKDWSIGDPQRSFTRFDLDDAVKDLAGPRSLAWIENNIIGPVRQGWNLRDKSRRYYRPATVKACPYTGVCFDEDILDAFRDKDTRQTIGDRFASIGDRLSRVIESELEYVNGEEGRRENAENYFDGALFNEDGNRLS